MSDAAIIAILLLTALVHAAWNTALKAGADRLLDMAAMRLAGIVFAVCIIPFAPIPAPAAWPPLIASAVVYMGYYAFLISAYKHGDLSQVYPIARGSAPLLVAIAAYALISETPGPVGTLGVVIISAGILMAGSGAFRHNLYAIGFAVATGLTIATNAFLGGVGVRASGTVLGYAAWLELLTAIPFVAFVWMRRRRHVAAYVASRAARRTVLLGFASVFSYLIALWAMTLLPLATVTAARETSAVFAALAGAVVMREPFAKRRIAAAVLVSCGIALLVAGGA